MYMYEMLCQTNTGTTEVSQYGEVYIPSSPCSTCSAQLIGLGLKIERKISNTTSFTSHKNDILALI